MLHDRILFEPGPAGESGAKPVWPQGTPEDRGGRKAESENCRNGVAHVPIELQLSCSSVAVQLRALAACFAARIAAGNAARIAAGTAAEHVTRKAAGNTAGNAAGMELRISPWGCG